MCELVKKKIDQTENARVKMKAFDVSTGGKQLILKLHFCLILKVLRAGIAVSGTGFVFKKSI